MMLLNTKNIDINGEQRYYIFAEAVSHYNNVFAGMAMMANAV